MKFITKIIEFQNVSNYWYYFSCFIIAVEDQVGAGFFYRNISSNHYINLLVDKINDK